MQFPETEWSQLVELGRRSEAERLAALRGFANRYWKPVYHYVRAHRRGQATDAEDVTQQFFATLIERGSLEHLSPERGSVRGFLRTSLRNYMTDLHRSSLARPIELPFGEAERDWTTVAKLPPEEAFDRAWRKTVIDDAIAELREQLSQEGRHLQFEMFAAYCLTDEPTTYRQVAAHFGVGEDDVRNRLREARHRLRLNVRGLVKKYLAPGDDLEDELAFVMKPR